MKQESLEQIKNELIKEDYETIKNHIRAYINNFGYLRITYGDVEGYYVFTDKNRFEEGNWTQYCSSIEYLDGWLYGAVQAVNRIMKPLEARGE